MIKQAIDMLGLKVRDKITAVEEEDMADNKLGETDYVEARSFMEYTNKTSVMIHDKRVPDGDDAAGRQKLRRLDPHEVAQYACEVSRHAFNRFEQLGWVAYIGDFDAAVERATETN